MPDLYQSGDIIPELDGVIQGGITIRCTSGQSGSSKQHRRLHRTDRVSPRSR